MVRTWLKALAMLVVQNDDARHAKAQAVAYVGLLLKVLPVAAFDQASLHHVASQCEFMPSFAKLERLLLAWWAAHKPDRVRRLAAPDLPQYRVDIPPRRAPPTEAEVALVGGLVTAFRAAQAAQAAALPTPPARPRRAPRPLSDGQLLAAYQAAGQGGSVRAQMLRARLGADEPEPLAADA
jgi:hypothetical protein